MEILLFVLLIAGICFIAGVAVFCSRRLLTWMASGSTTRYHKEWE